jgi:type II secretory pathway predicted ATPase ExeA
MSERVQAAFGLSRPPFDKDVTTDLLWMDGGRQPALDRLVQTVSHRQHALVLGEPGVGKTCVMRALKAQLSPAHFRVVYLAHVTLGRRDFYRQLCFVLGVEPKATPAALFEAIQRECVTHSVEHRMHSVVVLDEMHLMPDPTLSHLHLLSNFTWDSEPLLSMVFVGLPEFHDRLKLGVHRSLLTRIHTKVELSAGAPEVTATYVRKRLFDAGARAELFTADGLATLHEFTGGLLRSVDVLALAALRLAADEDKRLIDRVIVRHALAHTPLV